MLGDDERQEIEAWVHDRVDSREQWTRRRVAVEARLLEVGLGALVIGVLVASGIAVQSCDVETANRRAAALDACHAEVVQCSADLDTVKRVCGVGL